MRGWGHIAIGAFAAGLVCAVCATARADEGVYDVRIRGDQTVRAIFASAQLKDVKIEQDESKAATVLRGRAPEGRGSSDIFVVSGAVPAPTLLSVLKGMNDDVYFGGVVIDGRKKPPEITNDPHVSAHTIAVYKPDGSETDLTIDKVSPDLLAQTLGQQ